MKTRIPMLVVLLVAAASACAQQKTAEQPGPRTKIEAFAAQAGSVIVQGFTPVGTLHGEYGTVAVEAKEFTNATSGKKEYGITIEVTESGRVERENRSYIDYEEIESLVKGIDYVAKLDHSVTKLTDFQADYRTKGELEVTTFSGASGGVSAAVKSGRIGGARAFLKLEDLPRLRDLIMSAKAKLDAVRAAS